MSIKANIETGLAIKIEGELGEYQTLPIEYLIKIALSLQNLVNTIASSDISAAETDLDNFKIELSGYKKSSAIPEFVLTPRVNLSLHDNALKQRNDIAGQVDSILEITNSGKFSRLIELYPDGNRNGIIESVFDFTNSFDDSPTSFGTLNKKGEFIGSYSLHKLKKEAKQKLLLEIPEVKSFEAPEEYSEFREILVTRNKNKTSNKVINTIKKDGHSISYTPDFIIANNRKYIFNSSPVSLLQKEKDHYIIKNDLLDIYAVGETEAEAENDFAEEFDYLYQRLNSLSDTNLSDRFIAIKNFINYFVKDVAAW